MTVFTDFDLHRLIQVPREPEPEPGTPDPGPEQRSPRGSALLAALTGSHADLLAAALRGYRAPALLTAWVRAAGDGQVRVLVGGRPYFPPALPLTAADEGERRVLYPPGALATDVSAEELTGLLAGVEQWVTCVGRPDALWAPTGPGAGPVPRRGAFDHYATHLAAPYAWLVLAEPLPAVELKPELDRLVNEIGPLSRGEVSESKRIALERHKSRHRELAVPTSVASGGSGYWSARQAPAQPVPPRHCCAPQPNWTACRTHWSPPANRPARWLRRSTAGPTRPSPPSHRAAGRTNPGRRPGS